MKSALGLHHLPVLFSCTTPTDFKSIEQQDSDERSFVADSGELRGTGGALRDLAERFEDNDRIIVANGNSSVVRPLHDVVLSMLNVSADVTLHADGALAPTGFMLIRAGVLRGIARRGFVDFKEQALPVIARDHSVRVVVEDAPVTVPIRTLDGYIRAVRAYGQGSNALALDDPFVEDWRFSFGLIEDGADVGKGAHVHDSVVLRGARVESGAVLVRSVAGPGAVVPNGPVICDQVLGESGEVE
jgi:mannose-1-phosphate guanylyltransferase